MSTADPVFIMGRFPPPTDGQAQATRRLADLLSGDLEVRRIDLARPDASIEGKATGLLSGGLSHYLESRKKVAAILAEHPSANVIWTNPSPHPTGHARDLLTVLSAVPATSKLTAVVHWGNFEILFKSLKTRLTSRQLISRVDNFVFLSQRLADSCRRYIPPDKIFAIPNTVDQEIILSDSEAKAKLDKHSDRKKLELVFLSNMVPSKGYGDCLEAARLLKERKVDFRMRFAGRWPKASAANDFAVATRQKGLTDCVEHLGGIKELSAIRALLSDADVLMLPTYYPTEAQPLALIEAMAAATPVVSTAHAGIPEMVDDGVEGFLIPKKNPEALAEAISHFADRARWRLFSQSAWNRFGSQFHPSAVRRQWLELVSGADS